MRRVLRENALCALLACAGCATIAWLGLYGAAWNDYEVEARPAVEALIAGHFHDFLAAAPVYGGSLIERAPFALLPSLWGGGELAVYRMLALPCLLAAALLGVWLLARMRADGRSRLARAVALGVVVANPVTLRAIELGHPEDLLGACVCVAALMLAGIPVVSRRRAILIGALLGLAIANKQWAVMAAGVVLLSLPPERRLACLLAALGVAAVVQAPFLLVGSHAYAAGAGAAAAPGSTIFQPWQIWWFFGHHGTAVHGLFGAVKPGYRAAPYWAGAVSHPLALFAAVAIASALWLRLHGRRLSGGTALLAFAVTMLSRCLLDTWDTIYYLLPAILALVAWESEGEASSDRPPVIALGLSAIAWAQFQWLPGHLSPDVQSTVFLCWSLPLLAALSVRLLAATSAPSPIAGPGSPEAPGVLELRPRLGLRQPTTVSSFWRPVRTSQPPSRTTVRSSIRTPSAPGR